MLITDREQLKAFYACRRVWQGIPGIVRTKGGRTFVSLYSGDVKETYGNFAVLLATDREDQFGEPVAAAFVEGKYRCFDPVLWIDPLDRLWFIWNVMPGEQVMAAICDDPDQPQLQWREPFQIGRGIMMNKPTVLSTGEWLFPIAIWKLDIYPELRQAGLRPEDVAGSYVYKTCDNGKTFQRLGRADNRKRSFDEHMVLEQRNGVLKMLVRTTYGIGAAYSYDRGKHWDKGENSGLGGPSSRFFIARLRSGRVLLINHHQFVGRNNLTAFLSDDDGKTFPHKLLLDGRSQVAYPDAMEAADGYLYITYDRERGAFKQNMAQVYGCAREILMAKIREEDILQGKLVSQGSYLQRVVSKLGPLEGLDPFVDTPEQEQAFVQQLLQDGLDVTERLLGRYDADIYQLNGALLDPLVDRLSQPENREAAAHGILALLRPAAQQGANAKQAVADAWNYLQEHLAQPLDLWAMAADMQVSAHYLAYLFHRTTGCTLVQAWEELRLTKAKQLLLSGEGDRAQIARLTGFADENHLETMFLAAEGMTTCQYTAAKEAGTCIS